MLNRRTFSFELDILKIGNAPLEVGRVKQLDGTTLNLTLKNGERNLDLSDCVVRLFFKREDGYSGFQKTEIVLGDNGNVVINCIDEIFELVGDVTLEVEVVDLDGYIETSPEFKIKVIDKVGDDLDREIIRVKEVGLMEELKTYIENSVIEIDTFKNLLNELSSNNYQTLLEQVVAVKDNLIELTPQIQVQADRIGGLIESATGTQIDFSNSESLREAAELFRVSNEKDRNDTEAIRMLAELDRQSNEGDRQAKEEIRVANEEKRIVLDELLELSEQVRQDAEDKRAMTESQRVMAEEGRVTAEIMRQSSFAEMREDIVEVEKKVDGFSANGNFTTDIVVKGNVYPTLDGVKPFHAGPPTKNAGNVLMPYARAIGGFTKDGSGVRTIGFVAKPMDANPSLDITEEQNTDAVFLGTNVSQLYLYSKEKYPTIVSEGELSPIATQDWVMRLVEGLGLLSGVGDPTPAQTSSVPTTLFDTATSNQWSIVEGNWRLSDSDKAIMLPDGQEGLYKPLIAYPNFNEVTYVKGGQIEDSRNDVFVGLWKTENYIYGCRLMGNTLNVSYFGTNGTRGGANTFTIRQTVNPGDIITLHYNFSNDIWEMYKFDENNEPSLIYQMSKFIMSGFPEFYSGRNVSPTLSFLANGKGGIQLRDCPNPGPIRDHEKAMDYIF